jgi:hypothetical protein
MTLQEAVELYLKKYAAGYCTDDCKTCPLDARAITDKEKQLCSYLADAEYLADYYMPQEEVSV